jgi:ABC-2 type transport system permease protein
MLTERRSQPAWTQFWDLVLIELTNWRWSWRGLLITGAVTPLLSVLALGLFARDSGPAALTYVLTGNVVLSLLFGIMNNVQSHVVFMRMNGGLDYFATLPIRRLTLVLAMVCAFLALSLPSLAATVGLGALILGLRLTPHPALLLVVPLCALSLAGIGAIIGATARTPENGGATSLLVTFVLAGLGPVVIPPDRLPPILLILGRLSPATYAASAFRQALLGPVTGQMWIDLAVLALVGAATLWYVERKLAWHVI